MASKTFASPTLSSTPSDIEVITEMDAFEASVIERPSSPVAATSVKGFKWEKDAPNGEKLVVPHKKEKKAKEPVEKPEEEEKPAAKQEEKPAAKEEVKQEEKPVAKEEEKPAPKEEVKPAVKEEEKPAAKEEAKEEVKQEAKQEETSNLKVKLPEDDDSDSDDDMPPLVDDSDSDNDLPRLVNSSDDDSDDSDEDNSNHDMLIAVFRRPACDRCDAALHAILDPSDSSDSDEEPRSIRRRKNECPSVITYTAAIFGLFYLIKIYLILTGGAFIVGPGYYGSCL